MREAGIYALKMDVIDWGTAQRVGERIAGSPPSGNVRAALVEPRAHDFARRVSEYSGLETPSDLPAVETVDRAAWIAANLRTMRPMMAPLTDRLGQGAGVLSGPLRAASGLLLGTQIGALTGVLSQRVLGQYDVALLDRSIEPRLLLLAPNLAIAARTLSVDSEELVLWVAIHEITHAVQFTAVPWLRDHLGGMISDLLASVQLALGGDAGARERGEGDERRASGAGGASGARTGGGADGRSWLRTPDPQELLDLLARVRRGDALRWTLGEDRWQKIERIQAVMSVIEGHAEHTMDAIGAEELPSLPRLRAAMARRRSQRPLYWRVIERLLGLEMKMRQYEVGRRFCDAVVAKAGPVGLAHVWDSPEALPSLSELDEPDVWLRRTQVPAA